MSTPSQRVLRDLRAAALTCRIGAGLAAYTTFRLGGPCPALIACETAAEVSTAVDILGRHGQGWQLIGGGSNLVVADRGLPCMVLRYATRRPAIEHQGTVLQVSGSTSLDALAAFAVAAGLDGLVNCSGIPGTVGGAIVGNAGAFGWQVGDALTEIALLGANGRARLATPAEIGFSYRDSGLKQTGEIVLTARFNLTAGDPLTLAAERQRILELRRSKHPDLSCYACAGSFFRNIEPTSKADRRQAAGWFLEQVGAKQMRVGGAAVYHKHANIIIKGAPHCRAADVDQLATRMAAAVKAEFGLELEREARLLS